MQRLIIRDHLGDDDWELLRERGGALPAGRIIVPLERWLAERDALLARGNAAVWVDSHEEPDALSPDAARLPLIAINFPVFHDGRGLSAAVLLRTRLGFAGDLRAIGDVQVDVLSYMRRCGFSSFLLAPGVDAGQALSNLRVMSDYYQGSATEPAPLFRRAR
jgi:uncharacterized protein (DUF934 family)